MQTVSYALLSNETAKAHINNALAHLMDIAECKAPADTNIRDRLRTSALIDLGLAITELRRLNEVENATKGKGY